MCPIFATTRQTLSQKKKYAQVESQCRASPHKKPEWKMCIIIMNDRKHPQHGCMKANFTLVPPNGQQGKLMQNHIADEVMKFRQWRKSNINLLFLFLFTT